MQSCDDAFRTSLPRVPQCHSVAWPKPAPGLLHTHPFRSNSFNGHTGVNASNKDRDTVVFSLFLEGTCEA